MRVVAAIIACIALGIGIGFYLGVDRGYERAVREMTLRTPSGVLPRPQPAPRVNVSIAEIRAALIGTWQSTEDKKFIREFFADGSIKDGYEGNSNAESVGTWHLFMSPTDEQTPFQIMPETVYAKMVFAEEVLYFVVVSATTNALVLSYADRGGELRFTRLP